MKKMILHLNLASLPVQVYPAGKIASMTITQGDVTQDIEFALVKDIERAGVDQEQTGLFVSEFISALKMTSDQEVGIVKTPEAAVDGDCAFLLNGAFPFEGDGRSLVGDGIWSDMMAKATFADVDLPELKLSTEGVGKGTVIGVALASALFGSAVT